MIKTQNYRLLLCLALFVLAACSGAKKEEAADEGVATVLPDEKNEVTVMTLKRQTFNHELVSNGKVVAGGMADLRFESSGIVAQIYVKNGDRVHKGQKLAELDKFRLKNKTAQTKDALEKAKLELQDVLIGQGYAADDTAKVPDDIMQLARVKSGYDQTLSQYELAKYEEEHATLVAPFDGVVANLFSKPYNAANTSDTFCSIIGTQGMEADFTVLESELPLIKSGDKVVVTPYADPAAKYEGRISEINPLVDDKGMVKVKAIVSGHNLGLNFGVTVGFNLFDGNRRRELRNARIAVQNARLEREQLEQALRADLSNLWQAYQNNLQMLKLERQNLVAAKENHEIAMERYMLGNLSGIEMREAQKSLLDAEERILSAEYDTKLCEISLLQISGRVEQYLE